MNSDDPTSPDCPPEAATYRIWIAGPLDSAGRSSVAGVDMAAQQVPADECITVLQGELADLAALERALHQIRSLHFRVLGIVRCPAEA